MADPYAFVVRDAVERQSGTYTATLKDEYGNQIAASVLTSFTLTLYDLQTRAIINSRDEQNALNANQVAVDASGNIVWTFLPADMIFVNPNRVVEEHVALWEGKWLDAATRPRQVNHEVHFLMNRIVNT